MDRAEALERAGDHPVMFPYTGIVVTFHWELDEGPVLDEALPFDDMVRHMFPDLTGPRHVPGDWIGMHDILVEGARLLRLHGGLRVIGDTGVTSYLRAVGRDVDPESFGTMFV